MTSYTPPVAYTVTDLMSALHISRAKLYEIINSGDLRTYKIGRRRFCTHDALIDFQRKMERGKGAS